MFLYLSVLKTNFNDNSCRCSGQFQVEKAEMSLKDSEVNGIDTPTRGDAEYVTGRGNARGKAHVTRGGIGGREGVASTASFVFSLSYLNPFTVGSTVAKKEEATWKRKTKPMSNFSAESTLSTRKRSNMVSFILFLNIIRILMFFVLP